MRLTYKLEPSGAYVEVVKLIQVSEFNIIGKFKRANLSEKVLYKVAFVIKIEGDNSTNEDLKVTITITRTGADPITRNVDLNIQERDNWVKIESDAFENNTSEGDIGFQMTKIGNATWKENVFINAVVVKPLSKSD